MSKNEPMCMCKEGWFVGLGQEKRVAWMRGKLGQGVDSLKKGGWNPLTNYGLQMSYFLEFCGEINEIYLK